MVWALGFCIAVATVRDNNDSETERDIMVDDMRQYTAGFLLSSIVAIVNSNVIIG